MGEAFRLIARGDADVMLAGGCDSRLDPQLLVAYSAMKAVSTSLRPPSEVSRPFDAERDGFVLGEGAAVLVLESYRRAKRRGARIYAEITGYGSSFDAFGITRPEPEGKGAALSMTAALREARIDAAEIDYINAHGTSTRLNDLMETVAVKRVFGHRAPSIPMSSQKSMIGHLIGASGAVEAAATAISLERGVVPPTINLATPDPDCDLDYVPNTAREIRLARPSPTASASAARTPRWSCRGCDGLSADSGAPGEGAGVGVAWVSDTGAPPWRGRLEPGLTSHRRRDRVFSKPALVPPCVVGALWALPGAPGNRESSCGSEDSARWRVAIRLPLPARALCTGSFRAAWATRGGSSRERANFPFPTCPIGEFPALPAYCRLLLRR